MYIPFSPSHILEELIVDAGSNATAIMTDGGFNAKVSPVQKGGAVLLQHNDKLFTSINVIVDTPCNSVFPIEFAALAIARIASNESTVCPIYSDSQSSINIMKDINKRTYQKNLFTYAFNQPHMYSNKPIQWVQSHVEKRKQLWKDWTPAEMGNYIADKLTSRNWNACGDNLQLFNQTVTVRKTMDIKLSSLITHMQQFNSFSIRSSTGLYLEDIIDTKIQQIETTYLSTRDKYRSSRIPGARPYWVNKVPAAIRWTNRAPQNICEIAFRMKVAYNKHWTTSNQYRYSNTKHQCSCPNCGEGIENAQHILFNCQHIAMVKLREESIQQINQLIEKQKKKHKILAPIIDLMREKAYNSNLAYRLFIWNGLWPNTQLNFFNNKLLHHPYNSKYSIHQILKLSRIYTDAAKQLYSMRGRLINKKDDLTHPLDIRPKVVHYLNKITNYFEEDQFSKKQKKDTKQSPSTHTIKDNNPTPPTYQIINNNTLLQVETYEEYNVTEINDDNYHLAITDYNAYVSNRSKMKRQAYAQEQTDKTHTRKLNTPIKKLKTKHKKEPDKTIANRGNVPINDINTLNTSCIAPYQREISNPPPALMSNPAHMATDTSQPRGTCSSSNSAPRDTCMYSNNFNCDPGVTHPYSATLSEFVPALLPVQNRLGIG